MTANGTAVPSGNAANGPVATAPRPTRAGSPRTLVSGTRTVPPVRPPRRRRCRGGPRPSHVGRSGRASSSPAFRIWSSRSMTCFDHRTKSPAGRSRVRRTSSRAEPRGPAEHADGHRRGRRLRTGQARRALDVVEARPDGQRLVERGAERATGQGMLRAGRVLAAGLVDDRRGHGGELCRGEVLPYPRLEALGDEQVAVAVDALQATAARCHRGFTVAGVHQVAEARAGPR